MQVVCFPWAENEAAFRVYYNALLDVLCPRAGKVITASPHLISEDINSADNRALDRIAAVIQALSSARGNVAFVDLRAIFSGALRGKPTTPFLSRSVARVVVDALARKATEKIDETASARGLHLTLDGVHLNNAGAALAADAFLRVICEAK